MPTPKGTASGLVHEPWHMREQAGLVNMLPDTSGDLGDSGTRPVPGAPSGGAFWEFPVTSECVEIMPSPLVLIQSPSVPL